MIPASIMGIFVVIIAIVVAIVGLKESLIAIGISVLLAIGSAIFKYATKNRESTQKRSKYNSVISNKRKYKKNEILITDRDNKHTKDLKKSNKKDYTDYWETHCESCGELLEDCECDWRGQSKQDISQDEFEEINDFEDN